MEKKLKYMPYAQAKVIVNDDGIFLISYKTKVITIDYDGWLTITDLYSRTTIKHIKAFLKEYASKLDFSIIEKIYNDNYKINIETGEVI